METYYLFLLLILVGGFTATVPVFMSLFFTGIIGVALFTDMPLLIMAQALFRSMDKFTLVVVLFFILCGNIMTSGSIVQKLIKVANVTVGWLPGGLAMSGVIACGLFGAISGSTVATVVAIGGFMIPTLMENKYAENFATGIMTTSPILGIIIPPSISMIFYSMITNCSLESLFLTGFTPGILIIIAFSVYSYLYFRGRDDYVRTPLPTFPEVVRAYREGFWSLMLPVIIFGGIYSGAFTANEAAVVASVYAFIVEIFIHRSMDFKKIYQVTISSAVTSATLLIIVAGATVFTKYLTLEAIPMKITAAVVENITQPWVFLIVINVMLLIVGMFIDIISATIILTPIFLPILYEFNIDILHFGLLMTINLGIGYVTPPMGVSLYITGALTNRDLIYVSKSVMSFILIQLGILFVMTYWPDLVLLLPRLFYDYAG